ncbi:hypothetical protein ETAA8_71190 [Anatilimnocola aggregata]|uniref:Uncharacterized protein n=1 Tax=Anatilimnocola aggregata TaxID=2528021 RepID=A0A517YP01_9BACT|nr:hypothetical protein [Anatilimnocola aggregata]QDU31957.1 hypothetical protein ETAA8_71190 [Anatilimnocola aggregata]
MSFDPKSTNPYAPASTQPVAPKKSNVLLYVLLGIGGVALLVCCSCGGIGYFGFNQALGMVAQQIKPQLQTDPVIQEHIGTIDTLSMNMTKSVSEAEQNKKQGFLVFDIKGEKGSGIVMGRVDQTNPQQARLAEGELRMADGQSFPLTP